MGLVGSFYRNFIKWGFDLPSRYGYSPPSSSSSFFLFLFPPAPLLLPSPPPIHPPPPPPAPAPALPPPPPYHRFHLHHHLCHSTTTTSSSSFSVSLSFPPLFLDVLFCSGEGSYAVITGPTPGGIGAGFARVLARRGFNLVLVGRNKATMAKLTYVLEERREEKKRKEMRREEGRREEK